MFCAFFNFQTRYSRVFFGINIVIINQTVYNERQPVYNFKASDDDAPWKKRKDVINGETN